MHCKARVAAALHREEFKGVVRLVPASGERWLGEVSLRFETRNSRILDALENAGKRQEEAGSLGEPLNARESSEARG